MFKRPRSDFWNVGIVPAPIETLTRAAALAAQREHIVWLPDPGPWRYLADPFGLRRDGRTHVFVEAFDYRDKHAVIEHHAFGPDLTWQEKSTVLAQPVHLSYPFLIEHQGETFMVPESHQAREVVLYRARRFPGDWVREAVLLPDVPAAESSLIFYGGRWWMFYTVVGPQARDQRELHLAYAYQLTGPWHRHRLNPVLSDRSGARPGGTPFIAADGSLLLPVQDCSRTYGGAIRLLRIERLDEGEFAASHLPDTLGGDLVSPTFNEGLHTLSRCGGLSLIDAKRIDRSHGRRAIDLQRRWRRWFG